MPPDAAWPGLPSYGQPGYGTFTPEQQAAHRSPKGIVRWEDHVAGTKSLKMSKMLMKFASKPHLKFSPAKGLKRSKSRPTSVKRKKEKK